MKIVSLFKKEILEEKRASKFTLITLFLFSIFFQWFNYQNYSKIIQGNEALLGQIVSMSLFYIAPIVIPAYANTILNRSLQSERLNKSLLVLLTTGVDAGEVWGIKIITACIISYLMYIICIVISILTMIFALNINVNIDVVFVANILLVAPMISFNIVLLAGFLLWLFRNPMMISIVFNVGIMVGFLSFSANNPITSFDGLWGWLFLLSFLPVVLLVIFIKIISVIPKNRLIDI